MSHYINITAEQINELRAQGLKVSEITKMLGCSRSKINSVLYGKGKRPEHNANCPVCGDQYTYAGSKVKDTCGKESCKKELSKRKYKEKQQQAPTEGKVRPYTETANMMIVQNIDEGLCAIEIAQMYGRDLKDVQCHIDKITRDGTADRIRAMVKNHHKQNMVSAGSGLI